MSERDPAFARWGAIQLARWVGAAAVLLGILIAARRIEALRALPAWFGYLLVVGGLVALFAVPLLLARRWRTPR
jgi:hypothetical protein